MRNYLRGSAGLALLALASPAFAGTQSFTLDDHQFHFDIAPGYVDADTKKN
jgi:hypothetical protein